MAGPEIAFITALLVTVALLVGAAITGHKKLIRRHVMFVAAAVVVATVIVTAAKEVGPGLFFSLLIITVSFLPVFALTGQSHRLFAPLAYTKTYAMAFAAILFVRQIQKGKANAKQELPAGLSGLKIDQTLQVTRGVSLYLVDSMASKILVAVDSGGIKSVNVLPSRFEDELEEPEAFSRQRDSEPTRSAATPAGRQASRRSLNKTSTSDIDENLIKLLLTKSREAS